LIYLLEGSRHTKAVTAAFDGQAIRVTVPEYVMKEWAEGHRVSIEAWTQAGLHLLIEKKFNVSTAAANRIATSMRIRWRPDAVSFGNESLTFCRAESRC
jgi:hypothetical protein